MNTLVSNEPRPVMQQPQEQSVDVLTGNPAVFMNLGNGISLKQQNDKVNPRFPNFNLMGQDALFGQAQQVQLNLGSFQSNANFTPNLDPLLSAGVDQANVFEKRKLALDQDTEPKPIKKLRTEASPDPLPNQAPAVNMTLKLDEDDADAPPPVEASKEGTSFFQDNDVLSGRGGGTNVHPGNRNFRDLINLHRRAYLKARKNDKPAISRAIVRAIRESGGRFLKKQNKSSLWFEIGDDAAREKTSQALRQRAPEMRKLLFDTEREEARAVAEEQLRQQRMFMSGMNSQAATMMGMGQEQTSSAGMMNPALLQAMAANNKFNAGQDGSNQPFSSMFSAALLQNGINRLTSNGA